MSAPISIIAPLVPAAAGGGGKTAGGPLAGFDALMSAFFASADGVLQAVTGPAAGGQVMTDPALMGQTLAGQTLASEIGASEIGASELVPADASAALLIDAATAAGSQPTDPNAIVAAVDAPKRPVRADKILGGDAGKLVGQAEAEPAQTPQTTPAADAAAGAATAVDASVIVGAQPDDAIETPPPADPLTAAQMTAVMALMTPAPAPPPAPAKSAAPPAPTGSSAPPQAAEAPPLPGAAIPAPPEPAAAEIAAEPKPDMLADKAADLPTPASRVAQAATPKATAAKTEHAPAAAPQAPATPPVTAQAAAAPPPAAPVGEAPAKTRAGREEATPDAATAGAPAVRPGPTSTAGAAPAPAPQGGTNNDPGQGAADSAEPQPAETPSQAADPQSAAGPMAQPAAQPAPPGASSPPHAAAAARATPETVANLAGQIVKKLGARTTQFDLQLDPAGLGKVNVRIEINADGRVSAAMSFDTPQAAAELRSRANELQRALAQSGFDVTGGLSFDVAQDQGRGGSSQQNAFQNNENSGQAFRGRAFAAALETAGDAAQAALIDRRATPSGVDVRI